MTSQVYSGAAQGGEAGYKTTGTWQGAVVGAILGGIGGIFGDKAAARRKQANKEEQRIATLKQATQRRDIVRSVYLARAQTLAAGAAQESGGLQSSAVQGSLSSEASQGFYNIKLFDAIAAREIMANYYNKKAAKQQGYSDSIMGLIGSANGGGGGMGSMGGMGGGGKGSSTGSSSNSSSGMDYSGGGWNV